MILYHIKIDDENNKYREELTLETLLDKPIYLSKNKFTWKPRKELNLNHKIYELDVDITDEEILYVIDKDDFLNLTIDNDLEDGLIKLNKKAIYTEDDLEEMLLLNPKEHIRSIKKILEVIYD